MYVRTWWIIGVEADPLIISIDVIEVKFLPPRSALRQKISPSSRGRKYVGDEHVHMKQSFDDDKGGNPGPLFGVNRDGSR